MHFIKRAAFRAVSAQSTIVRSAVPSSTPFAIRNQSVVISAFRRFNSSETPKAFEAPAETVSEIAQERASPFGLEDRPRREERPRFKAEPNQTVYVGNLLFEATPADLEREFAEFGEVVSTRVAQDARGLSKGFGYVEFKDIASATKAIEARNDSLYEGRRMIVNYMTASSTKRATNPPSKTLFIGNLAFEMTDADLNTLFREIKNVIDVRVAIDRRTGQPRGFAHADFVDVKSAVAGMEQLQGKEVYSRPLRVDYSASQTRSAFPARGQGRGEERGERGGDRGSRY